MAQIFALATAFLMAVVGIMYSYFTFTGKIKPVATTWFLFSVTVALSLASYFFSGTHSFAGNMINVADVVMCWSILGVLVIKNKGIHFQFTRFEIICLALSGMIVFFWVLTREHAIANVLLQVILTIAYFPTLAKLWHAISNTEPLLVWAINWTATLSGLVASFIKHDALGTLYGSRALILISILIALMLRLDRKSFSIR